MSLTPQQSAALREISEVWPGTQAVIIGATALGFYCDMSWRRTADVDLVVALELDEFPGALPERPGWLQDTRKEHEFRSPQGVKLDLLPAGRKLLEVGHISWRGGHQMSLAGMDLAFRHAESHAVDEDSVLVAPPRVISVLKMVSYCDRPMDRERDLEDIAHLLDACDHDSDRRWEEAAGREYDLAPAYLLGLDVGRTLETAVHRELVDTFLARVSDPDAIEHAIMRNRGPVRWRAQEDALAHRLTAFLDGLAAAR
jgi:predicted nucleotidyltransferase